MNRKALTYAILIPLLSAVIGNAFISEAALTWYNSLDHPPLKLPLWGSVLVALTLYVTYGIVIYRTASASLIRPMLLATAVLIANELWNIIFFGSQNLSLTFWVTILFAGLVFWQTLSVWKKDSLAFGISCIYLAWVVLYDLPWLYLLSR